MTAEAEQSIKWNNKGCSLNNFESYDEALPYFDKTLKIDPNFEDARSNKGLNIFNLGRYG